MSNRDLTTIAVIVWAIAALVAAVIGIPMLLTLGGVHVDAGLIVNGLAAIGAFSAAGAAVWVATSDRRVRIRERDEANRVQAALVHMRLQWQSLGDSQDGPYVQVKVNNWGRLPIVDVRAIRWEWGEGNRAGFRSDPTYLEVVMPSPVDSGDRAAELKLYPTDITTRAAMAEPTVTRDTDLTVTIHFTDANGNTWQRTASTPPLRHWPPARIRAA
jgi:hypothetical protein